MKFSPSLISSLVATICGSSISELSKMPIPMEPFVPGAAIGQGEETGKTFTDSKGRKYIRDEKGTIRRA